jgi:hypothetical protein
VKLALAPALIVPVSNTPGESDVDVWAIVSLLTQVTVVPEATVTGLGVYALEPSVRAFIGIATEVPWLIADGVVGDDLLLPPQPAVNAIANSPMAT